MLLKEPVSAVPPPLSNVDCVEKDLKPKRQHWTGGTGEGERKCVIFTSCCVNVPRVLTGVVGSLSEEVKKLKQVIEISERKPEANETEKDAKEEKIADQDVWTSISDVCEKFQIYLADVIVNEKHRPEFAQLLSDIAEKIRSNSSSPLQALETVLGDSSVKFFNRFECQTGLYCILNCSQGSQTKPGKRYLTSAS